MKIQAPGPGGKLLPTTREPAKLQGLKIKQKADSGGPGSRGPGPLASYLKGIWRPGNLKAPELSEMKFDFLVLKFVVVFSNLCFFFVLFWCYFCSGNLLICAFFLCFLLWFPGAKTCGRIF